MSTARGSARTPRVSAPGGGPAELAYVIHHLDGSGGQERVTLEVARRLSRLWPVHVYAYAFQDPYEPDGWGEVAFHRIRPRVRQPAGLRSLHFLAAATPLLAGARRKGRLLHVAGACTVASDVVQVHFVHTAWMAVRGRLPAAMRRPPRAGAGGGLRNRLLSSYYDALTRAYMALERMAFTPDKTYLACSRKVAAELEEHFGLQGQVRVIHHGVDTGEFRPCAGPEDLSGRERLRRQLGVLPEEVVALFAGAYDRKGLHAAIGAVGGLAPAARRRVRLVALGQGHRGRFLEEARRAGCEDRILLLPPAAGLAPYFRAADLLLFPTLYEPFGMVIIEALACGLPCVVSRQAGAAELIAHGGEGILLDDPSDREEIAAGLQSLVLDDTARFRMGEAARRAVGDRTWDRVAGEHAEALAPLLQARGARAVRSS
ncbi:MAG TPA: glycosyltransferase family 4 protein [Candidatus Polarisedimenticolia bacterium]|nr:glycosyltransferase family 4 protein [Candidatus Polarisedimenticolia bacterium]